MPVRPRDGVDISKIEGNASPEITSVARPGTTSGTPRQLSSRTTDELFGDFKIELLSRLRLTEVSILPKAEEPEKLEGRVVFEAIADGGMARNSEACTVVALSC